VEPDSSFCAGTCREKRAIEVQSGAVRRMFRESCPAILWGLVFLAGCGQHAEQKEVVIRAGHFPDIVHSQALVGRARGEFEKAIGPGAKIDWKIFNAGPSAIEALFAGELDLCYIGPNPAINGYVKSRGEALRIVAGAASGGAGMVVREDSGIESVADLHGKRIATPQLGNTQDVACRAWLRQNGFVSTEAGGDVSVVPVRNPDQLTLFLKQEIDGAWTKEPWVARLIKEGGGRLFLDEREIWEGGRFVTAHLIASTKFLNTHPDLAKKWVNAHVEITLWINENPEEARQIVSGQVAAITGKALPGDVLEDAYSRTTITYDPVKNSLLKSAQWAFEAGYLRKEPDLSGIYDLELLNAALGEKGIESIP
jgi:NitT/TauT family transport system substrate-binding protein